MKTIYDQIRKRWLLIYSILASAIILLFCSKSSPLYPMNDWVDVHCFLTLGKGMLNGLIPYMDLYEQKGPVLYFIYAIVALFSQKNMLGQYILEVITFGLFLYYSAKLAGIYIGENSRFRYWIIPAIAAITAASPAFTHGGSAEQGCLFIFVYGLYSVLKSVHEKSPLPFRTALINGIFAGVLLWIKYTMLGFYLGLALFILVWYLVSIRDWKQLFATIGQFLLGIGIVSAVVLIYFLIVGGLEELFTCYFYNNIFLYSSDDDMSILHQIWYSFRNALKYNRTFPIFLSAGFAWLVLSCRKHFWTLVASIFSFAGLIAGTYTGAGYIYYGLVICAYIVFALIGEVRLLQILRRIPFVRNIPGPNRCLVAISITAVFMLCTAVSFIRGNNVYLLSYEKEDMPQYKFAQIINETEDATLLNFGFLDGGFYYAADALPTCPFFCTFNVNAPGMKDTQYEYVENGKVDYVITLKYKLERYHLDHSKYELISTAEMPYESYNFHYYLYRLKEIAP